MPAVRFTNKARFSTVDGFHGSDDLQRLDLRSSEAARSSEGSASADAAGDRRIQEEERSDRCRQARGLPTLRLPAGVLHGIDGDSREEANAAVSPSPGTASGAAEESCIKLADGNRSELQQAAPAPSRVFSRAAGQQGCDRQEYPTASATESRLNHATTTHRMCIDPIAAT